MTLMNIHPEKEKHVIELNACIANEANMNSQTDTDDRETANLFMSVKKVIEKIKNENITSVMAVIMGEFCFEMALFENAGYFFEKAIELDPGNSDAVNNIGVLCLQKGEFNDAERLFAKAIELNPDNMEFRNNLNLLHDNVGKIKEEDIIKEDEKSELRDMGAYWDACAKDNAMRHIATDNWQSEEIFHECGERDLNAILKNINRDYLENGNYRVLEIGCGIGRIIKPFAAKYPNLDIYGVDVSEEMIVKGKQRTDELKNVQLFANNGKDLNIFEDNHFHLIYSYIVFQHIPRKFVIEYFKEISHKLVNRGVLIFQMPLKADDIEIEEPPDSNFRTVRLYSFKEIDNICRTSGMGLVKSVAYEGGGKYYPSGWFTAMKIDQ
jgi:SAM-dependent methyltransferase